MSFTIPNLQSVAYRAQAAPDSGDFRIVLDAVLGNGVLLGCVVSPQGAPDMSVATASGTAVVGGTAVAVAGGTAIIAAAEANPRFDLITVTGAGALAVVKGTAAAVPVFPTTTNVVLAAVYVPTGTSAIDAARIVDKRSMVSGVVGNGSGTLVKSAIPMLLSGAADQIPLAVKAHAAQTANLLEVQNSSGVKRMYVNPAFSLIAGNLSASTDGATSIAGINTALGIRLARDLPLGWSNSPTDGFSGVDDVLLYRDAANVLAMRNGMNANRLHLFESYVNAGNYAKMVLGSDGANYYIDCDTAGTGAAHNLIIRSLGALYLISQRNQPSERRLLFNGLAGLFCDQDGVMPLGASNARFRDLYLGGAFNYVPLTIKLHVTQSSDALDVQDSAGHLLALIDKNGRVTSGQSGYLYASNNADFSVAGKIFSDNITYTGTRGGIFDGYAVNASGSQTIIGCQGTAWASGSASHSVTNSATALYGLARCSHGATQLVGVDAYPYFQAGLAATVGSSWSVRAHAYVGALGTLTNAYGVSISPPDKAADGTVVNSYGIYLYNHNVGTTLNYAIYSIGGQSLLHSGGSEVIPLVLKLDAAQTANAFNVLASNNSVLASITKDGYFAVGANQVLSSRKTGWGAPTGTPTRTTFDTTSVTLPQLAERMKALIDDLTSHGLIGA